MHVLLAFHMFLTAVNANLSSQEYSKQSTIVKRNLDVDAIVPIVRKLSRPPSFRKGIHQALPIVQAAGYNEETVAGMIREGYRIRHHLPIAQVVREVNQALDLSSTTQSPYSTIPKTLIFPLQNALTAGTTTASSTLSVQVVSSTASTTSTDSRSISLSATSVSITSSDSAPRATSLTMLSPPTIIPMPSSQQPSSSVSTLSSSIAPSSSPTNMVMLGAVLTANPSQTANANLFAGSSSTISLLFTPPPFAAVMPASPTNSAEANRDSRNGSYVLNNHAVRGYSSFALWHIMTLVCLSFAL